MHSTGEHSGFFVRSDGSFRATFGQLDMTLLKAQQKGESVVYPFTGVCSTEKEDLEGEVLIQKGLNFSPFMNHGQYNWNHIPFAMVGVPTGRKAWFENGIWKSQGEILGGLTVLVHNGRAYSTDQIVEQHNALKKSGQAVGLCQSVEGKVTKRSACGRFVEAADIHNIALTFTPINGGTSVEMLVKSLAGRAEICESDRFYEDVEKALDVQAAKPFMKESLEGASEDLDLVARKLRERLLKKGYDRLDAEVHVWSFLRKKFGAGRQ